VADDRAVIETGKPLRDRLELWFDERGFPTWVYVNKLPLRNEQGEVIGLMGITQSYRSRSVAFGRSHPVTAAVEYITQNYSERLPLAKLSKVACLSPRQLQRVFKAVFSEGPHEFLLKTRLAAACGMIRDTRKSIGEIADACGQPGGVEPVGIAQHRDQQAVRAVDRDAEMDGTRQHKFLRLLVDGGIERSVLCERVHHAPRYHRERPGARLELQPRR
jgi:AraC-like DNA-binding protein